MEVKLRHTDQEMLLNCAHATDQVLNSEVHIYLPRCFANVVEKKPLKVSPWNCICWEELFKVI